MLQNFLSHAPWLQIAVATIAYFAIGAIWYMPAVFGKYWGEQHNVQMTEESKKRMPMLFGSTFVLSFILCFGTALLLYISQSPGTCMAGIKAGLFVSGIFCSMPMAINYLYVGKPFKLLLIDAGYHIVGVTLSGIILSVWH